MFWAANLTIPWHVDLTVMEHYNPNNLKNSRFANCLKLVHIKQTWTSDYFSNFLRFMLFIHIFCVKRFFCSYTLKFLSPLCYFIVIKGWPCWAKGIVSLFFFRIAICLFILVLFHSQALVLCYFLETNVKLCNMVDKNVIEIGAGTGLVSIVASLLGKW